MTLKNRNGILQTVYLTSTILKIHQVIYNLTPGCKTVGMRFGEIMSAFQERNMKDKLPETKILQVVIPQKLYKRIVKNNDLIRIDKVVTKLLEKKYRIK